MPHHSLYISSRSLGDRVSRYSSILVIAIAVSICLAAGVSAADKAKPFSTTAVIDSVLAGKPDLSGKVVYLDFWASWCAPCRASFPWMNRLANEYESKGLQVVTINLDRKHDAALKFLDDLDIKLSVVFDSTGSIAKLYEVDAMPTSYLYDRTGKLQDRHRGFSPADTLSIRQTIVDLLNVKSD